MTIAMMSAVELARTGPRGFVPPHAPAADNRHRLSHLDPKPLWLEEVAAESPWRSPTFWLAYVLVMPVAGLLRLLRA